MHRTVISLFPSLCQWLPQPGGNSVGSARAINRVAAPSAQEPLLFFLFLDFCVDINCSKQ